MNRGAGLPAERTRLAWRRTTLAMAVVAVLTVRLGLSRGAVGALLAAGALAGWIAVAAVTYRRTEGAPRRHPDGAGPALPLAALATAGYAVLGVLLVLAAPPG